MTARLYVTAQDEDSASVAAGNDGGTPSCAIRNGVFYFGGHFNWAGAVCSQNPPGQSAKCASTNSTNRNHVAAVDATTGNLLAWNPGANSKTGVWALAGRLRVPRSGRRLHHDRRYGAAGICEVLVVAPSVSSRCDCP